MAKYSLEEMFGSEENKLVNFKSKKVTKIGFLCYINNLAVHDNEETVIGVLSDGTGEYSLIIHTNNYHP